MKVKHAMRKTVHVVPQDGRWAVKRDGAKGDTFATQADAIKAARYIVRVSSPSQFVVFNHDGKIVKHGTHGLPKVQDPPGKRGRNKAIQNAVSRVAFKHSSINP